MNYREAIIAEARSWVGTPFHDEARLKRHGVDCGQLLIGVYGAFGYIPPDYQVPHYPSDFAFHRDYEWYLSIVKKFAKEVISPRPGDIVLFKWGRLYSHGGIVISWPLIIHAWKPTGLVGEFNAESYPLGLKPKLFFSPFEE